MRKQFIGGLIAGLGFAAGIAFAATQTLTLGSNTGPGGVVTLFGSSSGSVTIQTAAAAGTGTLFQLPATNGSSSNVLTTDGTGILSWTTAGAGNVTTAGPNNFTGANTLAEVHGTIVTETTTNHNMAITDCGKKIIFTNASASTFTLLPTVTVPCDIVIQQSTGAGQVTVTNSGSSTFSSVNSYTKTKAAYAILGVSWDSGSGTNAHYVLSGDGA